MAEDEALHILGIIHFLFSKSRLEARILQLLRARGPTCIRSALYRRLAFIAVVALLQALLACCSGCGF